ncbi:RadC family protein [Candidatus Nanohalococcus occultus]|uniref:RadC family protein n=1 Tax=Candidatus Nanohalococcus occultus TaxID=2978047 RepID=UPI0039E18401
MDYTIKDVPRSEQPREKLNDHGAESLTDTELLSIILRTGTRGKNVKQLSGQILSEYSFQGLLNVYRSELEDFDGVSTVKSGQIKAMAEIANRMRREKRKTLESLSDVESELEDLKLLDSEKLRVFFLNSGNEVLGRETFDGGVSSVEISSEDLLKSAVSKNAAAIVIAHNHPSGKSEPTEADRDFTENLKVSGEVLGVELLDHLVVGRKVYSFRRDSDMLNP